MRKDVIYIILRIFTSLYGMRGDIIYPSLRFFSGLRQGINASSRFCTERVKAVKDVLT